MKEIEIARRHLAQAWIHSSEEDTVSEMVYRPATFDFPQLEGRGGTEGRIRMELRADGTCTISGIGPTDRPKKTQCFWELEGNDFLESYLRLGPTEAQMLKIVRVDADQLIIRKK